ncbi:MAG: 50S ribosomal protein L11 methyltransferase [SAR202 cluster bacterium]|nr:50S ribosomal protein L11 methyltransferase [Dehalococcoidia bacterium]MQG14734.1 50S ribosomal protein L11 methyltransferase [SAR202 cluster bacterium]
MAWQELSITVPHEYVEPISYLFGRYGKGVSTELAGEGKVLLRTYLTTGSRQRMARIDVGVRLVGAIEPIGDLEIRELPEDEDWMESWKSNFGILRIGKRLVIKPTWLELDFTASPDDIVIEIDPGIAFGTGYHPTTDTCLQAMEQHIAPGMTVLDLGTGSGILTIAAIKLGAGLVTALDIDSQAVTAARRNFKRLGINKQVRLGQGSVPHPTAPAGDFDLAVANISARGVADRCPFILTALKPGALFIASGLLNTQKEEVAAVVEPLGFSLISEWPQEEWTTLLYRATETPLEAPE